MADGDDTSSSLSGNHQYVFAPQGGEVEVSMPGQQQSATLTFGENGSLSSGSLGSLIMYRNESRYVWDGVEMDMFDVYDRARELDNLDAAFLLLAMEEYRLSYEDDGLVASLESTAVSCEDAKTATAAALSLGGGLITLFVASASPLGGVAVVIGLAGTLVSSLSCPEGLIDEWTKMHYKTLQAFRDLTYAQTLTKLETFTRGYNSFTPDITIAPNSELASLRQAAVAIIHNAILAPFQGIKAAYEAGLLAITVQTLLINRAEPKSDLCRSHYNIMNNVLFETLEKFYQDTVTKWDEDFKEKIRCVNHCHSMCTPCQGFGCTMSHQASGECSHPSHAEYNSGRLFSGCSMGFGCRKGSGDTMRRKAYDMVWEKKEEFKTAWIAEVKPLRDEVIKVQKAVRDSERNGYTMCQSALVARAE